MWLLIEMIATKARSVVSSLLLLRDPALLKIDLKSQIKTSKTIQGPPLSMRR
jgi:hypothetical protein